LLGVFLLEWDSDWISSVSQCELVQGSPGSVELIFTACPSYTYEIIVEAEPQDATKFFPLTLDCQDAVSTCGDGCCNGDESCNNCAEDCGPC